MEDMPVFVGWVEDSKAVKIRSQRGQPYAPIEFRFGDTHPSKLYSECLKAPAGTIVNRNWIVDQADPVSQRIGERAYGETHRRSLPIRVDGTYVGTLNVAFLGDPGEKDDDIRKILIGWAQDPNSALVRYIKNHLDFSGPAAR